MIHDLRIISLFKPSRIPIAPSQEKSAMRTSLFLFVAALFFAESAAAQAPPTPGPEHARLEKLDGTWDAVMTGSGAAARGVMKYKMTLGGLWLQSNYEGEFGGMKFLGQGMDTYDVKTKKYVTVWMDSFGTRPRVLEGTHDEAAKQTTVSGEAEGPYGRPAQWKNVTRFVDDDHIDFSMYVDDQEMCTIRYTRRKEEKK
jgi:hypothetical protein